jgi:hypothetical protein
MSTRPSTSSGFGFTAQASFTRPTNTTTYASGQALANSTVASSVVPLRFANCSTGGAVRIEAVRVRKSGTGTTGASFRVHLFTQSPVPGAGDGAVWTAPIDGYVAAFDVTVDRAFSNGAAGRGTATTGTPVVITIPDGVDLYGLIEVRGAYAPASAEQFTWILEGFRFAS